MEEIPMISILLCIRKNSKFFSKFLTSYLLNTHNPMRVELLVMASKHDVWNQDLFELHQERLKVFYEDRKMGKNGRHLFFNDLAEIAEGDWLWHMCDDHYLYMDYDEYLLNYIRENNIDPKQANIIVPRVENSGSVSHLISRGWYEATKRIGYHPNIDSYLNNLSEFLPESIIHHPERPVMWDFTTDPSIMTTEHTKTEIDPSITVHDINSDFVKSKIVEDLNALQKIL